MRKKLFYISGTLVLAALILLSLYLFAALPNRTSNGFTRTFAPAMISLIKEKKIEAPLEKIVGATVSSWFFSVPNRSGVIVLDRQLQKQDTMVYGLPVDADLLSSNSIFIDSPQVNFFANNLPALFTGKLNEWNMDSVSLGRMPFTRAVRTSSTEIVLRTLTDNATEQRFQKRSSITGELIQEAPIIGKQQQGGFESDGMLHFDTVSKHLYYLLYFSNQFYCMDTSLTVLYTGQTIDTTGMHPAMLQKNSFNKGEKIAPAISRVTVNQASCLGNGFLFVLSGLKADNEKPAAFNKNNVIDMYRLNDGAYAASFYLPRMNEEKINSIWVSNKGLLVLYKSGIRLYQLNF